MARSRVAVALLALLGLLAAAYLAACLLLYWQERAMVYLGGFTRTDAERTDFALARGGITLRGWVVNPGQPRALLYFGGNAEAIESNRDALRAALPGTTSYLLAYRGYGASEGEATQEALFSDAEALYDHVRERHPHAPVSVIGRSLGSGVASHLAAHRPVARMVLVTPFDSLVNVARAHYGFLPVRLLMRERYESHRTLPRHEGPLLVIAAERDEVVPRASTLRLVQSLPRQPEVLTLAGVGHNTLSEHPRYWTVIARFLEPEAPSVSPARRQSPAVRPD